MPDLSTALLGPALETQTPESFVSYVRALRQERPTKTTKPREKKEPVKHDVDPETLRCLRCGSKPRKATALCLGKPKSAAVNESEQSEEGLKSTDEQEKSIDEETACDNSLPA